MRVRPWFLFGLGLAGAIAVACANGTATDEEDGGIPLEEEEDTGTTPPSTTRDSASPPTPPQKDAATDDGSAGDGGVKLDGGDGGTTNPDGGTTPTSCAPSNTCVGATIMADVSGDERADVSTMTGSKSQWMKIRVSEDDSGVGGNDMEVKFTLTSPPGTVFNMRVYLAGDGSSQKCTGPDQTTSSTTTTATASLRWGESLTGNLSDDDRTVTVEVFNTSGTCAAGQNWTLRAEGNRY